MSTIIERIQQDILDPNISLSSILLKAKVLAYDLKNPDLKQWIKNELDGYPDRSMLPDYRIVDTSPYGDFVGVGFSSVTSISSVAIPTYILPDELRKEVTTLPLYEGVRSLEEMAQSEHGVTFNLTAQWLAYFNQLHIERGARLQCLSAYYRLSPYVFAQIIETTRSRLQDFILELSDSPWYSQDKPTPTEQVKDLLQITIYHGGTYIGGGIYTGGGDFAGRDRIEAQNRIEQSEENQHGTRDQPSP